MAICSFLGPRDSIYDRDLYQKLLDAVYSIVEQDEEIEFLYCTPGAFYDLCLAAVLSARSRFPQKKIRVLWVVREEERDWTLEQLWMNQEYLPVCLFDGVISPPQMADPPVSHDANIVNRKVERWAIQRSTHLICGLYVDLFQSENQQLAFAQRREIEIIDVTGSETTAAIRAEVEKLPERKRLVFEKMRAGISQVEIGKTAGLSRSMIHQILHQVGNELRKAAVFRLQKSLLDDPVPPLRCCILAVGSPRYKFQLALKKNVEFLVKRCGVTQFDIAVELCDRVYLGILRDIMERNRLMRVTAVVRGQEADGEDANEPRLFPACHAVEFMSCHAQDPLSWADTMMERDQFCICDLSQAQASEHIRRIAQATGMAILDVSAKIQVINLE